MNIDNYAYANQAEHEKVVDQYLAKLKTFLLSPDHGDGEWPAIPQTELDTAQCLITDLLQLKWGQDCDGDRPVRFQLWFRRLHRPVFDWAFLQQSNGEASTQEEAARLLGNLRVLTGAIGAASNELRQVHHALDAMDREARCDAAARPVYLVRYQASAANTAENFIKYPASLHLTQEDAERFQPEGYDVSAMEIKVAKPGIMDNPANNFAEYNQKLESVLGKVVSYHKTLFPLLA